ncbi:MAG: hypothetical protein LW808_002900 [Verrucomicrobiota bacterium]|nr:MAG: hypothetical protein LW808_002900 [Verrucomicrobiota bacterium]
MSSVVKWGLILLLLSISGGCSSEKNSSSRLPWAVPANWELRRNITADVNVQKVYRPADFNKTKTGKKF